MGPLNIVVGWKEGRTVVGWKEGGKDRWICGCSQGRTGGSVDVHGDQLPLKPPPTALALVLALTEVCGVFRCL